MPRPRANPLAAPKTGAQQFLTADYDHLATRQHQPRHAAHLDRRTRWHGQDHDDGPRGWPAGRRDSALQPCSAMRHGARLPAVQWRRSSLALDRAFRRPVWPSRTCSCSTLTAGNKLQAVAGTHLINSSAGQVHGLSASLPGYADLAAFCNLNATE